MGKFGGAYGPDSAQGAHLRGRKMRSTHLGYDCYLYGQLQAQKVRCLLRRHRMPDRIAGDVRNQMPSEVIWPTSSHEEAHRMIEALYRLDLPTLRAYKRAYPDHRFEFEPFIEWGERWHAANQPAGLAPAAFGQRTPSPAPESPFGTWVTHAEPLRETCFGALTLRQSVVYFSDAPPALRVDVHPSCEDASKFNRIARIYIDLGTGAQKVVEFLPGRCRGYGLNPLDVQRMVGLGRKPIGRRTVWDDPAVKAARERARLRALARRSEAERAEETVQVAASMAEAADADVFAPHLVPPGAAR